MFDGNERDNKPICGRYREFVEQYGFQKMVYDSTNDEIEKMEKVSQIYIVDFFQFVQYQIDKGRAEKAQREYEDKLHKFK